MKEHNEDDELEIGEITERDRPDRIKRPPNNELIEYDRSDRGDKKKDISSSAGGIGGRDEELDRLSKRLYGFYIVIAILCISTIFLYFEVNDLGNRIDCINQSLTEQIDEFKEGYDDRINSINRNLAEQIGKLKEESDNRIDELESKTTELEKLLPPNYNGTVSLNKSIYHINESATVTVDDKDRNINLKISETVKALVMNNDTSERILINLTETGLDTGEFTGTFMCANETNSTQNRIGVRFNDTIEIIYKDEKTVEDTPKNRTVNITIKQEEP